MGEIETDIHSISDALIYEIVNAVGLPKTTIIQGVFSRIFHRATERLATIGFTTDRLLAQSGLKVAASWMHSNFCENVTVRGNETIPPEGPLLIISNHSGTVDSFLLASQIGREDLKIICNDIQFFKKLPHIAEHLVFLSDQLPERVAATRAGIRQLQKGGAFLLFGTGRIDPDPEVYRDAQKFIDRWSPSIELFLRSVPETRVLVTIVSGVLSKHWGHHPLVRLRGHAQEQRRLAEFGQVLYQLFFPGALYLNQRVSFDVPVSVESLRRESQSDRVLPAVIRRGKALLEDHCRRYNLVRDNDPIRPDR
jgi:hypothetical protein